MELWCCCENEEIKEIFDSEETAKIGYEKWCQIHDEKFNDEVFERCYCPLSWCFPIWTKDNIESYNDE